MWRKGVWEEGGLGSSAGSDAKDDELGGGKEVESTERSEVGKRRRLELPS